MRLLCPIICQVFAPAEFKFVFKAGETKYYASSQEQGCVQNTKQNIKIKWETQWLASRCQQGTLQLTSQLRVSNHHEEQEADRATEGVNKGEQGEREQDIPTV